MNYNTLRNKPTINYKEIIGDNTVSEVGGITEEEFDDLLDTDLASYYTKAQIDELFSRSFVYREKSGSIVTFDCPTSITTGISEVTSEIVAVQAGSGDPSPTNVRPITGWSEVNVYDSGKNLFDISTSRYIYARVQSGNTLYIQQNSNTTITLYIAYTDGTSTSSVSLPSNTKVTFNVEHNVKEMALSETIYNYLVSNNKNMMVSLQDFDSIEAYSGTTYTTALKDGQGNPMVCYGGQLTNDNGVQRLELTHGYIASYNGETLPSTWISDRDVYATDTTPTIGAEVVYVLSTPQEITQDSLTIASHSGVNNIWCDSGDITVKALDKIIQE